MQRPLYHLKPDKTVSTYPFITPCPQLAGMAFLHDLSDGLPQVAPLVVATACSSAASRTVTPSSRIMAPEQSATSAYIHKRKETALSAAPHPASAASPATLPTPSLRRRLCSMLYESMLLFGVIFISTWLFSTLLQQRNALYLRHGLEIWLFAILGLYFVWFWTHGGQTLAMKTWRIRLLTSEGAFVGHGRAVLRFLLSWLWFLPGLALAWALQAKGWMLVIVPGLNFLVWVALTYLDPQRQFLHDRLAGTRMVDLQAPGKMP